MTPLFEEGLGRFKMRKMLLIQFEIEGDLCCLSHRETLTLWQRILIRAGLPLVFSGGFNPRPRLSLPLPRPVGVQSDRDLLCAEVSQVPGEAAEMALQDRISRLLPEGCRVHHIQWAQGRACRTAREAAYVFCRGQAIPAESWNRRISRCREQLASEEPMQRVRSSPKHPSKTIDLRSYIEEINGNQDTLRIRCRIDGAGTVRPEELLEWLEIGPADLDRPPLRTGVVWIQN